MREIIYYTCNSHRDEIEQACRKQLLKSDLSILSVSLNKKIDFGDTRIIVRGQRSPEMMFKQILIGLKASKADVVFFCENDILYHPSHFYFFPSKSDTFFYNTNVWRVRYPDGFAVWTDNVQQISGCCADRKLAIAFYERRIREIKEKGFNRRYEANHRTGEKSENWLSDYPNLDIRHEANLTGSVWKPSGFRNPKYARGWKEARKVDGWGRTNFDALTKII